MRQIIANLARQVRAAGIKRARGEVVVDPRLFQPYTGFERTRRLATPIMLRWRSPSVDTPHIEHDRRLTVRSGGGEVAVTEFLSRDGIRLAYETAGSGAPGMAFVHGWLCDRSYFDPQFDHFAGQHAVATVDLRGHGESGRPGAQPGSYDVDVLAEDVLAVVAAAGLTSPLVAGHSLGALIALACAARSSAICAVVMVDPAPITNESAKAFFRSSVDAVDSDEDGSWRRAFVERMFLPTDVVRRSAIIENMAQVPSRIAGAAMLAMAEFDAAAVLGEVGVPVLSIGSAVPINSPADLRTASPTITIGQTVGAGHFNQLEVPEQVNAMIERFMVVKGLAPDA